jgi:TRAP-type C4-dicarboxylate transport system permease small subunit
MTQPTIATKSGFGRMLFALARAVALAGGAVLTGLALMSVWSIIGRAVFQAPVQGDFELIQVGCAMCIAAFLPHCQLHRRNIIVDFFTAGTGPRTQLALDALGALLLATAMAVVAWRTGAGAVAMRSSNEASMIRGIPLWIPYAAMAPCFALTALAGIHTAYTDWLKRKCTPLP